MKYVFRFKLPVKMVNAVRVPVGAQPLSVEAMGTMFQLWFIADADHEVKESQVVLLAEGDKISAPFHHLQAGNCIGRITTLDHDTYHVFWVDYNG